MSDLHYSWENQARRDASTLAVSNLLAQILHLKTSGVFSADPVVVFTGDLIFDGSIEADFTHLKKHLLDPLAQLLEIDHEQILLVPGNHDINSSKIPRQEWILGDRFEGFSNLDALYTLSLIHI